MALTINTNIKNEANGYSLDASQVKGGYVVVANQAERDAIPAATKVNGTTIYQADVGKEYRWNGSEWLEASSAGSDSKLDKHTAQTESDQVYGKLADGSQTMFDVTMGATATTIPRRDTAGRIQVADGVSGNDAVNFKQLSIVATNLENGTGTGSLVQKRLKSDGVTWTTAKAYQGASTAFGGGTQAGRTEEEFNAYFWDSANGVPLHGGQGKNSEGEILDNNGLTYEKSYSYAVAEGDSTKALGRSSHAEGQQTQAIGASSHSEGSLTKSLGTNSHAEGRNSETVGNNSHAEGTQTIAQGYSSHSEGNISKSIGDNSHSEGYNNQSVGTNSHAEGSDTIANGLNAHTEGWLSKADGDFSHVEGYKSSVKKTQYVVPEGTGGGSGVTGDAGDSGSDWVMDDHRGEGSHAEGILTQSSGYVSHSEGLRTVADGHYSHAEGQSTYTKGLASHAEGNKSTALGYAAHAEGNTTKASGNSSHSEGYETTSSGAYSHAESVSTIASGDGSHAEGNLSNASGIFSHAEGKETVASNDFSHAEGLGSTASGNASHAEGSRSVASGQSSHSEGIQTTASHDGSHSEGYQTRTSAMNQHVGGQYNADNSNALFIIGNGTETNRKNAFAVLADGRVKVQTAPKEDDDVVRKLELDTKQATLASGTNIKTINGNSLLGSGDLVIESGGTEVTPNPTLSGSEAALSALQIGDTKYRIEGTLTTLMVGIDSSLLGG